MQLKHFTQKIRCPCCGSVITRYHGLWEPYEFTDDENAYLSAVCYQCYFNLVRSVNRPISILKDREPTFYRIIRVRKENYRTTGRVRDYYTLLERSI